MTPSEKALVGAISFVAVAMAVTGGGGCKIPSVTVNGEGASKPAPRSIGAPTSAAARGLMPDPVITPGATLTVDPLVVCAPGYAGRTRKVSAGEKAEVYKRYGIASHKPHEYEVDHLISLELGGSNDLLNLWPEPYSLNVDGHEEGASQKDLLENKLHELVCSKQLSLPEAQKEIAHDWVKAYTELIGPFPRYKGALKGMPEGE